MTFLFLKCPIRKDKKITIGSYIEILTLLPKLMIVKNMNIETYFKSINHKSLYTFKLITWIKKKKVQ